MGLEYQGNYFHGLREGKGTFKFANGDLYEGPFVAGMPEGKGIDWFVRNVMEGSSQRPVIGSGKSDAFERNHDRGRIFRQPPSIPTQTRISRNRLPGFGDQWNPGW